jgi:hypothetical protein
MPAVSHVKPWEIGFRGAAKVAPGWTVTPHRGKIRLQVRRAGQTPESVVLPLDWSQSSVNPALQLIGSGLAHRPSSFSSASGMFFAPSK